MLVGLLHVHLDEGARQLLFFPRRRGLAGAQSDNHVLPADRLAGVQRDVLDDAVARVEDAKHGRALRHRRNPALSVGRRGDLPRRRQRSIGLRLAFAARGKRKRDQQRGRKLPHAYSGIQGS
jgi:hypothetical protein